MAAPCRHITRPRCGCAPAAPAPVAPPAPPLTSAEDEAIERAARVAALLEVQRKILRRKARESLYVFFKWAWSIMQPGSPLEDGPHIEALCFHFQTQLEDRGRAIEDPTFKMRAQNMLINVPPRSLKTAILAYATVWAWLRWPTMKIGYMSTNPRVAQNAARVTRDLMAHGKFLDLFRPEWEVRTDQDALSDMGNSVGGLRVARGLNSKVTGEGYDWLIIDDPHDLKDSKQEIESACSEYNDSVHNRINSPSTSIRTCIMQRVKPYDLASIFIRSGQWLHVRMPMEYEPNATCPCGKCTGTNVYGWKDWRTVAGEVLHPRFTEEFLKAERHPDRLGEFGYAAQMQQRPESPGGGSIKRAYWRFCRVADMPTAGWPRPPGCQGTGEGETPEEPYTIRRERNGKLRLNYMYISVDAAAKKTTRGSNYGMLAIGGYEARVFVVDDRTRRGSFDEILDTLRDMIRTWQPTVMLIEAKAAGGPLLETLEKELLQGKIRDEDGAPIFVRLEAIEPDGDKEARLDACLPQLQGRFVYLLEGASWLDEFVREMADFPNGNHDDRVDTLSQALTWGRDQAVDELYNIPL
jgi:predicted phage terminase large subunit-like protein